MHFPKSRVELLKEFGGNLWKIRRRRGLTQAEFAARLGLSREGYANYERGRRAMDAVVVWRIRHETQIDPLELDADKQAEVQTRATVAPDIAWSRKAAQWRAELIAAREAFDQQQVSALGRRLNHLRDVAAIAAATAINLRLTFPEFGLQPATAVAVDWTLLSSFAAAVTLAPFQIHYAVRFLRWRRAMRRAG